MVAPQISLWRVCSNPCQTRVRPVFASFLGRTVDVRDENHSPPDSGTSTGAQAVVKPDGYVASGSGRLVASRAGRSVGPRRRARSARNRTQGGHGTLGKSERAAVRYLRAMFKIRIGQLNQHFGRGPSARAGGRAFGPASRPGSACSFSASKLLMFPRKFDDQSFGSRLQAV